MPSRERSSSDRARGEAGPADRAARSKYERLIARAKKVPAATTIVVHPCDETSLRGAIEAAEAGIIVPILVGPAAKIAAVAREHRSRYRSASRSSMRRTARQRRQRRSSSIHEAKGELLMKGSLHTDELMREVTSSKTGLRTARRISHVFIMDVPTYSETLFITDAAINIFPDLDAKRDIVQNAIDLFTQVGLGTPRVAILSAVETVTSKIPSTIEAAALCKMAERGQITGGILDGPLAFDNAIDPEAARIKGIKSEVAGRAQILVVPDLEAGNMLAKNLTFLAKADAAGIVLGARVPIILTSRADSVRSAHGVLRGRRALRRCAPARRARCRRREPPWIRSSSSTPALRASSSRSSASKAPEACSALIKGQMDGIGTRPRLRAKAARQDSSLIDQTYPAGARSPTFRRRIADGGGLAARDARASTRSRSAIASCMAARTTTGRSASTRAVLASLERYVPLAPLHQPNNLAPIRSLLATFARSCRRSPASTPPSIAATARSPTTTRFPSTSTPRASAATAFTASPTNTSPSRLREVAPEIAAGRVIVAHLGSGASMCALADGRSVESTMGFTALDGLPMGTRPGQIDPGVVLYLIAEKGMSAGGGPGPALPRLRPEGPLRHQQRHARARRPAPIRARRSPSTISSTASGCMPACWRRRSAGSMPSCSPPASARTRPRSARASPRSSPGSAPRSIPRPMRPEGR